MNTSSHERLEMTDDLIDYVRATAFKEAKKRCHPSVDPEDVAQECVLKLLARPPRFDPSRGTKPTTLLFTCIIRIVSDYLADEAAAAKVCRVAAKFAANDPKRPEDQQGPLDSYTNRRVVLTTRRGSKLDVLRFIDNEESRQLCELYLECGGNVSEVARRLGLTEGTVRYRLKLLEPRLRAAGFDPFPLEAAT